VQAEVHIAKPSQLVEGKLRVLFTENRWKRRFRASEPIIVPEAEAASRRVHSPTDPAIILVVDVLQIERHIMVLADSESAANSSGQETRNVSEEGRAVDADAENAVLNLGQRLTGLL